MMHSWVVIQRIENILDPFSFIFFWLAMPLAFLFYKLALQKISEKRHNNLKSRFRITFVLLSLTSFFALLFWQGGAFFQNEVLAAKCASLFAFISLFFGAFTVIRFAQIIVYLYLFFRNMGQGVPRLIANLFTILFSTAVFGMIGSYVFEVHFSTLLATSAIFSVVLGLALQDTLGNLFAGLTLQLDQPFKIGDWVEMQGDTVKWLGQIHEITWRATYITTFSEEMVMIPNRLIAQSKVILFSHGQKPVRLFHTFRFPFHGNREKIQRIMVEATAKVSGVFPLDPGPRALITEVAESYLVIKIFYSIQDFSLRYRIGDQVISQILKALETEKIELGSPLLHADIQTLEN